ncbi:hypothetical protein F4859DRAFT_316100 [Xylaria cf. heliscus]|nr:hypothetical protein F4859DRAFT_316100 [Xylaria cf. heliscus]
MWEYEGVWSARKRWEAIDSRVPAIRSSRSLRLGGFVLRYEHEPGRKEFVGCCSRSRRSLADQAPFFFSSRGAMVGRQERKNKHQMRIRTIVRTSPTKGARQLQNDERAMEMFSGAKDRIISERKDYHRGWKASAIISSLMRLEAKVVEKQKDERWRWYPESGGKKHGQDSIGLVNTSIRPRVHGTMTRSGLAGILDPGNGDPLWWRRAAL